MWPYTGKKTFQSNLEVSGRSNTPRLTSAGRGNLEKEYFKKFAYPSTGQFSFSMSQISADGRVYSCYGLNNGDITEQLCRTPDGGSKVNVNVTTRSSKQLHEKNVNRLKVVLSMPEKERRMSLSHVTGAIMRNEIVPSEMRLQNEAFLSDFMRTTTPRLPPLLRRKSLTLAKGIEGKLRTQAVRPAKQRAPLVKYHEETRMEEDEGDIILPAITVDAGKTHTDSQAKPKPEAQPKRFRLRGAMPARRRSSGPFFNAKVKDDENSDSPAQFYVNDRPLNRKDSVTRTTESISEQFRAAMQGGTMDRTNDLNVAGKTSHGVLTKQLSNDPSKSKANGYKARHEYGKNLEKNWFKNHVMKQSKTKNKTREANPDSGCELRLDIFYSPEPESDSDMLGDDMEDNAFLEDASLQCGGYSTATAEVRSKRRIRGSNARRFSDRRVSDRRLSDRRISDRRISDLPANAIMEEDEGDVDSNNDDSSESDIEIVLKENQLIQRKTKHKMRKKRNRQLLRYKTFMDTEPAAPAVTEKEVDVPLTDQEIRALRLNLRNKERLKKLKGKRKFLQVANAVYIVAQFKKILNNIRKRKRNVIKKRQQRIAAMVAKRLMKETKEEEEQIEEEEREPTPKPTLKEQFMSEIGNKLVFDIDNLKISSDSESEREDSESEPETGRSQKTTKANSIVAKKYVSKFAMEIKKVSLEDTKTSHRSRFVRNRIFKRRNTLPKSERPFEFVMEVPCKPRRKPTKAKKDGFSRFSRRPPSPEIKCACFFHNKMHARQSQSSISSRVPAKCQHQIEVKKQKMKKVKVQTRGLFRTHSVGDLRKYRPIELADLLKDIDIPAKEIKLQILARKFRRQRRLRQRVKLSPCRIPERSTEEVRMESDSGSEEAESDDSDKSDYDFVYGAPFVGCGVMWHQKSRSDRRRTWSEEELEREVKKLTRVFHELKECRYLRMDSFNTAIMSKLNDKKLLL